MGLHHRRAGLVAASSVTALLLVSGCQMQAGQGAGAVSAQSNAGSQATAQPTEDVSVWQTQWGPLSAADRDLVKKVRLASLWEMTMAQEAVKRGRSPRVRQISAEIVAQHMNLDQRDRALAAQLNIQLPTEPSATQQGWMNDIRSQSGDNYDHTYVKWLRFAHGQVFALIASVRGTTQNSLVRKFAEVCNAFVLNHQRLLESTGLTDAQSFPTPPAEQ